LARAEELARSGDDPLARAWILALRASRALAGGDLGAFVDGTAAAVVSYEAAGDARDACNQKVRLGNAYVSLADPERAEVVLREALAGARRMGLPLIEGYAHQNLGHALLARDLRQPAIDAEDAAIAIAQRLADPVLEAGSLMYRAEASGAVADAERAVELLSAVPPFQAVARAVLARTLLANGDPRRAMEEATRAHDAIGSGVLEEGEALVLLVHVEALEAAGRADEARAAARIAAARVRDRAAKIANVSWRAAFLRERTHAKVIAAGA
jgi:tetratricopeptide (TPR) repeat protein